MHFIAVSFFTVTEVKRKVFEITVESRIERERRQLIPAMCADSSKPETSNTDLWDSGKTWHLTPLTLWGSLDHPTSQLVVPEFRLYRKEGLDNRKECFGFNWSVYFDQCSEIRSFDLRGSFVPAACRSKNHQNSTSFDWQGFDRAGIQKVRRESQPLYISIFVHPFPEILHPPLLHESRLRQYRNRQCFNCFSHSLVSELHW